MKKPIFTITKLLPKNGDRVSVTEFGNNYMYHSCWISEDAISIYNEYVRLGYDVKLSEENNQWFVRAELPPPPSQLDRIEASLDKLIGVISKKD